MGSLLLNFGYPRSTTTAKATARKQNFITILKQLKRRIGRVRCERMNRTLLLVVVVAVVVVAVLAVYFASNSTFSVNPTPSPSATTHPGIALYNQYCASCHGSIASSARLGYTAQQIQNAITTVPGKQQSLGSLTATQIQEIADALKLP